VRRLVAVLLVGACNQIFGVKDTRQIDAAYFDAPADAPFTCPPPGIAPGFAPALHQDVLQNCIDYDVVGDRAIAECVTGGELVVSEGPRDQMMSPMSGIPVTAGNDMYDLPRLSSDGKELYLRHFDYATNTQEAVMFTRAGDGMWQPGPAPPFARNVNDTFSTITSGPTGDRLFVWNGSLVEEWVHEAAGWRDVESITVAGLTPNAFVGMNPADSKRALIYSVDRHTYYTDRPDESSPFRTAVRIAEVPDYGFDATMTPDCGRIYVTGLHSVFYVSQP